jgi:hypothetical protein
MRYTLVCIVFAFTGCSWFCPKPPKKPEPPPKREACLEKKPPELIPWETVSREAGCPEPYTDCLTAANGSALASNLENLIRYVRDAWTKCSPKTPVAPSPTPTPAPQPDGGTPP